MKNDKFVEDDGQEDDYDDVFLALPRRVYHIEYYDVIDIRPEDDVVLNQCGICGKLYIYGMDGAYKGEN